MHLVSAASVPRHVTLSVCRPVSVNQSSVITTISSRVPISKVLSIQKKFGPLEFYSIFWTDE